MSFIFHFNILGLTSWIWTNPPSEELKVDNPSIWNSYEGFNLEHCLKVAYAIPTHTKQPLGPHHEGYLRAIPNKLDPRAGVPPKTKFRFPPWDQGLAPKTGHPIGRDPFSFFPSLVRAKEVGAKTWPCRTTSDLVLRRNYKMYSLSLDPWPSVKCLCDHPPSRPMEALDSGRSALSLFVCQRCQMKFPGRKKLTAQGQAARQGSGRHDSWWFGDILLVKGTETITINAERRYYYIWSRVCMTLIRIGNWMGVLMHQKMSYLSFVCKICKDSKFFLIGCSMMSKTLMSV
jgi:hypothetical protein